MDVDNNLPWHVQKIPFVSIRLAGPRILHGHKHVFLHRNGTNDHEQPRSVPLVPMLSGGGLRHTLTSCLLFGLKLARYIWICLQGLCLALFLLGFEPVREAISTLFFSSYAYAVCLRPLGCSSHVQTMNSLRTSYVSTVSCRHKYAC